MTDSLRTLTTLLSNMPTSTVGGISAQDIRDFLYSILGVVPYRAVNAAGTTATEDDVVIAVTTGNSDRTVALPAVATTRVGKFYILVKVDSGSGDIIADGNSSETINGATTKAVDTQWNAILLINTGAAWLGLGLTAAA